MSTAHTLDRASDERINVVTSIPFFLCHLIPFAAIWTGVSTTAVVLCVTLYVTRIFFITAGYHRYFSHRTYKLNRVMQFLVAFAGSTAAQKGPLWWAAHHRAHHRYADTDRDPHSPKKGFWWSHVGWILCDKYAGTDLDVVRDLAKYPELRFIDKHNWIGPWMLGIACFLIGGWSGLVIGFFLSTVFTWHGTFFINSLAHVFGRRRFETNDTSRNSFLLAFLTLGEGWHNNHHKCPTTAKAGFFWWQWDPTYYALKVMSWVGLARDLRPVPLAVLTGERRGRPVRD